VPDTLGAVESAVTSKVAAPLVPPALLVVVSDRFGCVVPLLVYPYVRDEVPAPRVQAETLGKL
jgi:hypothetical protein